MGTKRKKKSKVFILKVKFLDGDRIDDVDFYYFTDKYARYRYFDAEFTQDSRTSLELEGKKEIELDDICLTLLDEEMLNEKQVIEVLDLSVE